MSYTSLSPVCVPDGQKDQFGYEGEFVLDEAGSFTDPIIIPSDIKHITVTVNFPDFPTLASAKVQATTELLKKVKEDPSTVEWVDWPYGEVFETSQDTATPVTAIRLVQVQGTGSVLMTVRAQ